MKAFILAGGYGTRLSEETDAIPKPMIRIGGKPILWHIMKAYSHYGINDFVILLGYKGYVIKEYFANYFLHQSDVTIDLARNNMEIHHCASEPWRVTLVETGENTMTGGRILRAHKYAEGQAFMLTYGDGVSDVNIQHLLEYHKSHGGALTMTSILPEGRYGAVRADKYGKVIDFTEKPHGNGGWINAGFFVCEPEIFDYLNGDDTSFEGEPLQHLSDEQKLYTFQHRGSWRCMDTLRDKNILERLWADDKAFWKVWESGLPSSLLMASSISG
jgi:glucose-1-phosphate cytidylyltransferase